MSAQPQEEPDAVPDEAVDVPAEPDSTEPEITEEDAAEPADEPEPEPEPAAALAEPSDKEIERLNKALDAETKRHTARIGAIMGDDATALVQCEACDPSIPGWHWPAEIFPEDSPQRHLYELLGGGELEFKQPAYLKRCPDCNGRGKQLSGAAADLPTYTLPCERCKLMGYIDTREPVTLAAVTPLPAGAVESFVPAQAPEPVKDFLGRPLGHTNYGKMTGYLTPDELALDVRDGFGV